MSSGMVDITLLAIEPNKGASETPKMFDKSDHSY